MGAVCEESDPLSLVDDYRLGSFFLATPESALLASGVLDTVAERDPDELATLVTKLLADSDAPVAVGALPFDPAEAPHVVLPETVRWAGPPVAGGATGRSSPGLSAATAGCVVEPVPAPEEFERYVAAAVTRLNHARTGGSLRKVVLARALRLTMARPVEIRALLANLVRDNRHGYTYAVDLPADSGAPRTLVGASPELLMRRSGPVVTANPIAGTLPRLADPAGDRRNAAALLASGKDQAEHQVVVEAVVEALRPFCRRLAVAPEPSLVSTPAVWHLSTEVTGELIDTGVTALRLAYALHPTPAVCGTPPELARHTIAELEPFDRGFYAGAVGWCDAAGDGQWAVAIRCAEITGPTLQLFSGAGIMPDSQPHLELAETSAKFQTLLHAMGLNLEI
ncbi:MAG: isochorismate synthase [Labedaea sp.]